MTARATPLHSKPTTGAGSTKPRLVVLTGAGISCESGLATFRGRDALCSYSFERRMNLTYWENDPELVLDLYNRRRAELEHTQPNAAHVGLAELEAWFEVTILTQNVDDLHERAGSRVVWHLHGKLREAVSTRNPEYVVDVGYRPIRLGDRCPDGGQLRPNIVWFDEPVHHLREAIQAAQAADFFVIIGTSLEVQPAASLPGLAIGAEVFCLDPEPPEWPGRPAATMIRAEATQGIAELKRQLIERVRQRQSS